MKSSYSNAYAFDNGLHAIPSPNKRTYIILVEAALIYCLRNYVQKHSFFIFLDVSYTKTRRVRLPYLPAHLTLVGCYGSEKKLIDCAHHDYTSSTSMDISISCISSGSRNESNSTITGNINTDSSSSDEFNSLSAASLFIAIICIFVVIILVVVLIIFIRRSRKHAQR